MKKGHPAVKKLKRGESLKRVNDDVLAITWKGTRIVNILTNIPGLQDDTVIQRRDKKTGAVLDVPRPNAIGHYNDYMGGVDLSDQRVSTYRRHMKSLTWYLQLFYHMFGLIVVQAYLLSQQAKPDKKLTQRAFTLAVIDGLIAGRRFTKAKGRVSAAVAPTTDEDARRFDRELEHAPLKMDTQSKCVIHAQRADTVYVCKACDKRMCVAPCFYRYHYMKDYLYDDPKKAAKAKPIQRKK